MLNRLEKQIKNCQQCKLGASRLNSVPGEGNLHAEVMMVGEAPGKKEDETGRPFIGSAGKILSEILMLANIKREDVFITSILKCRPPENRNPKTEEIKTCLPWLIQQIQTIKPKVICTMGRFATKALTGIDCPITKIHGEFFEKNGEIYFPIFHPAAIFYNPKLRKELESDLKKLREYLNRF